ncbi:hypothetical protein [Bacteroides helcogenes]|uniref:Uncharacterized protein n=1 Tax=Bacteroides helcogenes (strain ATCC 35417 / DSM 20613 / JCM 6297 / CCUG 15421 / P 36-108) TaxID=693979 RepID=E6SS21_BACT6|nr:hypothetical protein [Bacteroides helcogenes]ADV43123.1 hypothetical protein Bache_1113 [Bacteroides helcogenes P 36-108]MDY5239101.1 hypothetical protein [Bacteroides helcogenes]
MKRTSYIIFGMLLAGLLVMGGTIVYLSSHGRSCEDFCMRIDGEQKVVTLPECKVIEMCADNRTLSTGRVHTIICGVQFSQVPLSITPSDSSQGTFSYAAGMEKYMTMKLAGDTLRVTFAFPDEKLEERYHQETNLQIRSSGMSLSLPESIKQVSLAIYSMETTVRGFRTDSMSFKSQSVVRIEDCEFASLASQAWNLYFDSGTVSDLYLDLDNINSWKVNADSFHIDTEHLTASRRVSCFVQKGECRQVLWTPKSADASLQMEVKQAAKVEIDKDEDFD